MSAPPSTYQTNLSRREEMAVTGTVLSDAPWKLAGAAGVVVTGADLLMHLAFHLLSFRLEWATALSMGAAAFFVVAGAGALVRSRHSRALRWARSRHRDRGVRAHRAARQLGRRRRLHRAVARSAGLRPDRDGRVGRPAARSEGAGLIPAAFRHLEANRRST